MMIFTGIMSLYSSILQYAGWPASCGAGSLSPSLPGSSASPCRGFLLPCKHTPSQNLPDSRINPICDGILVLCLSVAYNVQLGLFFVPLTAEAKNEVHDCLYGNGSSSKVLVQREPSNIQVSRDKIQCLRPHGRLNDEVQSLFIGVMPTSK